MIEDRVVTTEELRRLVVDAERLSLFRQPPATAIENLDEDEDVRHTLVLVLHGHELSDTSRPYHHRTSVFMKLAGTNRPYVAYLDVRETDWRSFPTVAEYRRGVELAQVEALAAADLAKRLESKERNDDTAEGASTPE